MIKPKVLFLHSNKGITSPAHNDRIKIAKNMGMDIESFCIADYVDVHQFSKLNLMYKLKNKKLLKLYELLKVKFRKIDVLIHYNGCGIHPDFLKEFNFLKIFHSSDDPDASNDLSRPLANKYDIQAIGNPTCIKDYYEFGCKNVFFWPNGAQFYKDNNSQFKTKIIPFENRNTELLFIGDSFGIPKYRGIHALKKFLKFFKVHRELSFLYKKKVLFNELKSKSIKFNGYGNGWENGFCSENEAIKLYSNSMFGFNMHNSSGPINFRLYDYAAFGVCQFCDCKSTLDYVFKDGEEIIGYSSADEFVDLYSFYLKNKSIAKKIAFNARKRYLADYNVEALWKKLNSFVNESVGIDLILD